MSIIDKTAEWAGHIPWRVRLVSGVLLVGSPIIFTYKLWEQEWTSITSAYVELWRIFKTGDNT